MTLKQLVKSPFAWATAFFGALGLHSLVPFLMSNASTLFAGWSLFSLRILPSFNVPPMLQQQLLVFGAAAYLVVLVYRLARRWRARGGTGS